MSSYITLAHEGVFPITTDLNGQKITSLPATGMAIPGTIQGEGKLAGMPSLFIRLAHCNLRCMWELPDKTLSICDTPHASFDTKGAQNLTVNEIIELVKNNIGSLKHIVISGGEPLMQKEALAELTAELKKQFDLHITLETNGTIFHNETAKNIDLISISPKLKNSVPNEAKLKSLGLKLSGPFKYHNEKRVNLKVLQSYIDNCNKLAKEIQLKFVIGLPQDEQEIIEVFLNKLSGWKASDILLMPLGASEEELIKTTSLTLEMAIRNGWRFSPRMHISLFGNIVGV